MKWDTSKTSFFDGNAQVLDEQTPVDVLQEMTGNLGLSDDPFFVLDVGDLVQKVKLWRLMMPRVAPHYAVKCNGDQTVLQVLASLGLGFDCASKKEIQSVLALGVDPSRIIYAHPAKPASHLRFAASVEVPLMTFDNEAELYKVKEYYPEAKLVIRIRCDALDAQCPLGIKFGTLPETAPVLLETAHSLGLNVVGVSFHVGSGCREPQVFRRAIASCREVFDIAESYGFTLDLLDLGGGFPGEQDSPLMKEISEIINDALDVYFPEDQGVKVIAEPGRYMVHSAFTLATQVTSKREVRDDNDDVISTMYYINDGVYGAFNCVIMDHSVVTPEILPNAALEGEELLPCSIWGPTCDSMDQVVSEARLPRLAVGSWLMWRGMGAYTIAAASGFNGFCVPNVHVVIPRHTWMYLETHLGSNLELPSTENQAACADVTEDLPHLDRLAIRC